jgi:3-deoxy-D-manno-octulosonate 8-phosphate phosphatase (KDO 8-P phosphatase)
VTRRGGNRASSLRRESPSLRESKLVPAKIPSMPKPSATARARKIKLILFDVDGVLTDGKIWIFPACPAPSGIETRLAASPTQTLIEKSVRSTGLAGFGLPSTTYVEAKGFHAHDGAAISFARLAGIKTGIITKRISETVALRARDLKLDHVYQGKQDKLTVFREILEKDGITAAEAAFVGDDVIDLPVLLNCGFAIAVKNARPEVKAHAHWVTPHAGGDGAARDAVEYILKAQGKWKKAVAEYTQERGG